MTKLVLLRHSESTWNEETRFTGWTDVDLSQKGLAEAKRPGQTLKAEGFTFDSGVTSVLKRAIRTMWIALKGRACGPILASHQSWPGVCLIFHLERRRR
jgi:2,3-bisphosphoglycerate-dependent phosphoglycerate mutase